MDTTKVQSKTKWMIDPEHSEIGFKAKHLMFTNVSGDFKKFGASVITKDEDFSTAKIEVWVNPASIDTANEKRDEHLTGSEFFDVEKFEKISFKGNDITKIEGRKYELSGDLTIKDVTKEIKLEVESGGVVKDPFGKKKAIFRLEGKINRKDWGLNWNMALETGGVLVGDEIRIQCEVQLTKE